MIIAKIIHKLRRITHTEKWGRLLQKSGVGCSRKVGIAPDNKNGLNHRGGKG